MQQRKASDIYTLGSNLNWRTRALLCWVAPRGIVAAAVYTLFALRLEDLGHTQAELLVPLTFLIIIGTVFLQGITARPWPDCSRSPNRNHAGSLLSAPTGWPVQWPRR